MKSFILFGFLLISFICFSNYQLKKTVPSLDVKVSENSSPSQGSRDIASNSSLKIQVDRTDYYIREGDAKPVEVTVSLQNFVGSGSVNLSVAPENSRHGVYMSVEIVNQQVSLQRRTALLRFSQKIENLPFKRQKRRFIVSADGAGHKDQAVITFDVDPVDAPNIYLLAGQSNMVGSSLSRHDVSRQEDAKDSGPGGLDEPHYKIKQLNVTANSFDHFKNPSDFTQVSKIAQNPFFIRAEDPLHHPSKGGTTVGLGLTFAKKVLEISDRETILVPAAWGNTGFCLLPGFPYHSWNPSPSTKKHLGGTSLFDRAVARTNLAIEQSGGILRGVLWQQGGRDSYSADCANDYKENLKKVLLGFREKIRQDRRGAVARGAQSDVPVTVGTRSRGKDSRGDRSQFDQRSTLVDQAHKTVGQFVPVAASSVHDYIVPPQYPCGSGSCVHFGAKGYRQMGRQHYSAYMQAAQRVLTSTPSGGQEGSSSSSSTQKIFDGGGIPFKIVDSPSGHCRLQNWTGIDKKLLVPRPAGLKLNFHNYCQLSSPGLVNDDSGPVVSGGGNEEIFEGDGLPFKITNGGSGHCRLKDWTGVDKSKLVARPAGASKLNFNTYCSQENQSGSVLTTGATTGEYPVGKIFEGDGIAFKLTDKNGDHCRLGSWDGVDKSALVDRPKGVRLKYNSSCASVGTSRQVTSRQNQAIVDLVFQGDGLPFKILGSDGRHCRLKNWSGVDKSRLVSRPANVKLNYSNYCP